MDLEGLKERILDLSFPTVTQWRQDHPGGKVVGTFPVWVPREIIHAAGALPIGLYGAGDRLDIEYADARMQSFMCSISRSTLELGLRGMLPFLDGLVFPSICDVARNLSGVWGRNFPDCWVIYLHLPENITSPHAVRFMVRELDRMRTGLEKVVGQPIDDEALRRAIADYNENRRLLRELYRWKRDDPDRVTTYETVLLTRAGAVLAVEDHNQMLREVLAEVPHRSPRRRDRIRVVLEGSFCEQPPMEFIQAVEEAGCHIVDDDFLLGSRYLEAEVPEHGDPLENLARVYLHHARPSAIRYDGPTARAEQFLGKIRDLQVDGVIFAWAKFCDPAQFDYVILKDHLEKAGIPHLTLEFEEKMTVFETVRNYVETFVESILFYA